MAPHMEKPSLNRLAISHSSGSGSLGAATESTASGEREGVESQQPVTPPWSVPLPQWDLDAFGAAEVGGDVQNEKALWVDELMERAPHRQFAIRWFESMWWKVTVFTAIGVDIVVAINGLITYEELDEVEERGILLILLQTLVAGLLCTDLLLRVVAYGLSSFWQSCHNFFVNMLEVGVVAMCVVDLFIHSSFPFALGRLLRGFLMFWSTIDALIDSGVDLMLARTLGDIVYISPDNATAKPSQGIVVIEKTHFLPMAFADLHLPVTVKGGFIELVYLDLNNPGTGEDVMRGRRRGRDCTLVLKNILLVLGPTDAYQAGGEWRREDVVAAKHRLVELITKRTDKVMDVVSGRRRKQQQQQEYGARSSRLSNGKGKTSGKDNSSMDATPPPPGPTTFLGKLRQKILKSRFAVRSVKVDIRNLEVCFEDTGESRLLPQPVSIGFKTREIQVRLHSKASMNLSRFRAKPSWEHQQEKWEQHDEANKAPSVTRIPSIFTSVFSDGDAAEKATAGSTDAVRLAIRSSFISVWCDRGAHYLSHSGSHESIDIAQAVSKSMSQLSTTRARFLFERAMRRPFKPEDTDDTRRSFPYTHFFEGKQPKVHRAVMQFHWLNVVERFKFAGLAARDEAKRRQPREQLLQAAEVVMERHLGNPIFNRFREAILPHSYILLPMGVSLHAISQPPNEEDCLVKPPCQVYDLELPKVRLQVDREQIRVLRRLRDYVEDWMEKDRKLSLQPFTRIADVEPGKRYEVIRAWWEYAVHEIIIGIVPKSTFANILLFRRRARNKGIYSSLLLEQYLEKKRKGGWPSFKLRKTAKPAGGKVPLVLRSPSSLSEEAEASMIVHPSNVGAAANEMTKRVGETLVAIVDESRRLSHYNKSFVTDRSQLASWSRDKLQDTMKLQVTLNINAIIMARADAKKWYFYEINQVHPDRRPTAADLRETASGDVVGARKSLSQESDGDVFFGEDEPSQARLHIGRVELAVVELPRRHGPKIRREIVRLKVCEITAIWSRAAPIEEWELLTEQPPDVADHQPFMTEGTDSNALSPMGPTPSNKNLPIPMAPTVSTRSRRRGVNRELRKLTWEGPGQHEEKNKTVWQPPFAMDGEPFPGWLGLEVSVSSFCITHCQAPSHAPSLRRVLGREVGPTAMWHGRVALEPTVSTSYPSKGEPPASPRGSRLDGLGVMRKPPRRPKIDSAGIMLLLRAARWSPEALVPDRVVVTVHLSALRLMEDPSLATMLGSVLRTPPGRPKPDPLNLDARRNELEQVRSGRRAPLWNYKVFELTTGVKIPLQELFEEEPAKWRIFLSTAEVLITTVSPYTDGGRFLVSHTYLPRSYETMSRSAFPACCSGGSAFPLGPLGTTASATARALGTDLLEGVHGPGPPPAPWTPRPSPRSSPRVVPGKPSSFWPPSRVIGPEEWQAGDSVRITLKTVNQDKLEEELVQAFRTRYESL